MAETKISDNFEVFLVEHGFITQALYEKIKEQAQKENVPVINILASQKLLSDEALAQARGAFFNIPYVSFKDKKVPQVILDLVPKETYRFYRFFAFEKNGQNLKVAITDPSNLQALEALEFLSKKNGYNIQLFITDEASFSEITNEETSAVVGEALADLKAKEQKESKAKTPQGEEPYLQNLVEDAPISKIVDVIITNAIDGNASDIHIEPTEKDLRVRYRVDGILRTVMVLPGNVIGAIVSKIKIMSNLKIDESRLPQDGRFHYETATRQVDMRVSILPNINGEKIVMRILDKSVKVPTLNDLGFRGKSLEWTLQNIKKTHGVFLITGPTGSGKSTTLYALLSMLNTPKVNIITLEDPVEYFIDGVNQSQINPDIGFTFASGLRSILRQDPNIIMVGEVRDKETAELAVQAALTGHLVFSTLHTNDAIGALPRLMDMGVEPFLLAASVNAIGAQRLVRKICQNCKQEIKVVAEVKAKFKEDLKGVSKEELGDLSTDDIHLYAGKGCDKCGNTGYKGRIAILELFDITAHIQEMILKRSSPQEILEEAQKSGMITLQQDGMIKAMMGITTYEEIIRVISE